MSKQITYRYNPDTDSYERIYPTLVSRFQSLGLYLVIGAAIGIALFVLVFYVFATPSETSLRKENARLRSQYNTLQRRLDASLKVMDGIRQRDDNYYRVLLQMDPMSNAERYSGIDNEERYRSLEHLPDAALLTELTRNLDLLDREMYVQSRSFDELKSAALKQRDRLRHTPAIMPVNVTDYNLVSGFGYRTDPIYFTQEFHTGVDFAGSVGEPVMATADGIVKEAGWKGGKGYSVVIDHGYNYITVYAHLSHITVTKGQQVSRGYKVGEMGSTGKSTNPHLHYEVRFKDEPQNPVNFYFMDVTPEQYDAMMRRASNAGNVMD